MTDKNLRRSIAERAIELANGVLRLEPAWVARTFLPPGRRMGLPEENYSLGKRGAICERWLASTTVADNATRVPDEGLSFLNLDSHERMSLREAVDVAGPAIMGVEYAATHPTLDRLAKIFDYGDRLPYHFHQMRRHAALVGRNPKEEAYHFPGGVEMGPHPESFLGVHPYVAREKKYDLFLPHLQRWEDDRILQYSRAYQLLPGDGFHIPAGTLHAPGSALTIELQEDSDVLSMLQANVGGTPIDKELLFKDVRREDRERFGEKIILEMIDWETSGDPFFFENRHTPPIPLGGPPQEGEEDWIFYNTRRFSGTRVTVRPKMKYLSRDRGVYNLLVWKGAGRFDGHPVAAGDAAMDELLVCHAKAVTPVLIENDGSDEMVFYKFFGPDVNPHVPFLPTYPPK